MFFQQSISAFIFSCLADFRFVISIVFIQDYKVFRRTIPNVETLDKYVDEMFWIEKWME